MSERIIVYAVNGNGLGHIVRTLAIMTRLRERLPSATFLFLTSCEDTVAIWREGFSSVKVPSLHSLATKAFAQAELPPLVQQLTAAAFAAFQPTVLISDTFPRGTHAELVPFVETDIRKFILLRPCPLMLKWQGYLEYLARYEHYVLPFAPGTKVEFPDWVLERAVWVGPVLWRTYESLLSRAEARRTLGLPPAGRILLVTLGGGGSRLAEGQLRQILGVAKAFPNVLFAVLRPPLGQFAMPAPESDNVRLFSHFPILECFHAFDGALSSCGINGSAELVYAGVPMVWLPYANASRDQIPNVQRNLDRGFGVAPADKNAQALADAITAILDPARSAAMRRSMEAERGPNGADVAADHIAAWLAQPRSAAASIPAVNAAADAGDA